MPCDSSIWFRPVLRYLYVLSLHACSFYPRTSSRKIASPHNNCCWFAHGDLLSAVTNMLPFYANKAPLVEKIRFVRRSLAGCCAFFPLCIVLRSKNWLPVIGLALRGNQSGTVRIGHSSLFKIMSNPPPENTAGMDAAITSLIGTQRVHSI